MPRKLPTNGESQFEDTLTEYFNTGLSSGVNHKNADKVSELIDKSGSIRTQLLKMYREKR
jgi:hypothetical protein